MRPSGKLEMERISSVFSVRTTHRVFRSETYLMWSFIVRASMTGPEDDRLSEEELVAQMTYAPARFDSS